MTTFPNNHIVNILAIKYAFYNKYNGCFLKTLDIFVK